MGLRTAEKLLTELTERGEGSNKRCIILRHYALLATGNKAHMERALAELNASVKDVCSCLCVPARLLTAPTE